MYTGISTTASILRLEFDFYEIDSWGNDAFAVFINCFTIQLGLFNVDKYQGMRGGFVEDVHFETNSLGSPTDLGFGGFDDQRHNVTIDLPSRFFNGLLQVQFGSNLDRVIDNKSYGIDNIKITAYQCWVQGSATPIPATLAVSLLINNIGLDQLHWSLI